MGHYRSNVRDLEFNLFELFGADQSLGHGPFAQMDPQTARGVLDEINRLATGPLADSFADADRNPPVFDPATSSVTLPESFKASYRALLDGEWFRLDLPEHLGGFGASPSLRWAAAELILGANPAAYMYQSGPGFAAILERLGTPAQQQLARTMIERQWGATMVLTEPDAGSDVGAGRTRAFLQPDGSWHLEGVKRFITSADWDVPENIVHLVLARPEGVAGAGGPGTKGLSLFVVPKFLVNEDGSLGERNGAYVTNVEKKMGLKVSATCEVTFGDKDPAIGTLVGDVHDGIAQMFQVIEYARMMVGTKAISTLSTGYLNALDFAKARVQGADLTKLTDKAAPRVTITHHPDVRRMLMLQKAYAEGMRSLVLFTSSYQDRVEIAAAAGERDLLAEQVNDLLLPIVKGFGSERSYELLAVSLQTLGGSGYLQDYPLEQYIRDAKIDTLYEGTTSIQGQDLFFRKIVRNKGAALTAVMAQIQEFASSEAGNGQLKTERAALATAVADVQSMLEAMIGNLTSAAEHAPNLYKVGLNTTRLLMSLGDLIVGWLLQRAAVIALDKLAAGVGQRDQAFYAGKIAAARFFAQSVLPELSARSQVVQTTTLDLMDLPEAAF
ncbi:MAG TPA: acyl-CoA dehydrogenase [Mycobacteriales bacterium]|nr:acyl-CoA dehydrogenase [Mycobacteriales bacterium]